MTFRTLPTLLVLGLAAVGCGVSDSDGQSDPAPTAAATDREIDPAATATAAEETAGGDDDPLPVAAASAEEAPYFRAVEESASALSAQVEQLFQSPLGLETEEIANRLQSEGTPAGELTPAEEATLREFFTTFWTEAAGHVAVMGDDLRALDVPDTVQAQHDAYLAALDAVVDATDDRVAEIRTRDAADLTTILWEPDEELETMESACASLNAEAGRLGIETETCPQ